jgi:hypothetical protein
MAYNLRIIDYFSKYAVKISYIMLLVISLENHQSKTLTNRIFIVVTCFLIKILEVTDSWRSQHTDA